MKFRIYYLVIVGIFYITNGCRNDSQLLETEETIAIDIGSLEKKEFPGKLIELSKYLKLETNDDCAINYIDKIIIKDGIIYILDIRSKSVFAFNLEGKYLRKFYHYGRGPGEYTNLRDFEISNDGENIFMIDIYQNKLYQYTIDDVFLQELKLDFGTNSFAFIDENLFVFYQKNRPNAKSDKFFNNNIVFWNFEKQLPLNGYFPIKENRRMIGDYSLYRSKDQIFYCPFSTDKVYKISKEGISPYLSFNGSKLIKDELWEIESTREFIRELRKSKYYYRFRNFYKANDVITFALSQENHSYKIFYSISTGEIEYGIGVLSTNPNRIPGNIEIKGVYGDDFVTYFQPSAIMNNSNEIFPIFKNNSKLHKKLIQIAEKTNISDNPILVFFQVEMD